MFYLHCLYRFQSDKIVKVKKSAYKGFLTESIRGIQGLKLNFTWFYLQSYGGSAPQSSSPAGPYPPQGATPRKPGPTPPPPAPVSQSPRPGAPPNAYPYQGPRPPMYPGMCLRPVAISWIVAIIEDQILIRGYLEYRLSIFCFSLLNAVPN